MVSVTYGHAYLNECGKTSDWSFGENSGIGSLAIDTTYPSRICMTGTCDDAANEYAYYSRDISSLVITTSVYPKIMVRWKTSAASNGLGARVRIDYTDASTQDILNAASTPQFSQKWTVTTATLTPGKTVKYILLYVDDYPNTVASGTFSTYYEYILFYTGTFTFPNVGHSMDVHLPPRYATIPIPGRIGDITQNLGSESAFVNISCDLDVGTWKRLIANGFTQDDYVDGEVFYDISHNSYKEPFQWLKTGQEQFKATLETPILRRENGRRMLNLLFREYRHFDASLESYIERFGLNL